MNYKISIITVCYNAADEIERTIQSVIEQTFHDYEYIIVDGASKDSTMDIVDQYSNRIHKIVSEPDNGIYDAMNKGTRIANGEWMIFMNAGDLFSDNRVLENVFADCYPDTIQCLYSDVYMPDSKGNWSVCPLFFENGGLIHQSTIYRRKLHNEFGLYVVTKKLIISDYLFFVRLRSDQVKKIDTIIAYYKGGGISSDGNWARQQSLCADVAYGKRTFWGMLIMYFLRQLGDYFPDSIKRRVKKILAR